VCEPVALLEIGSKRVTKIIENDREHIIFRVAEMNSEPPDASYSYVNQ
jgi:hypothetical protein